MYSVVRSTNISIKEMKIYYKVSRVNSGKLKIRAILDIMLTNCYGIYSINMISYTFYTTYVSFLWMLETFSSRSSVCQKEFNNFKIPLYFLF